MAKEAEVGVFHGIAQRGAYEAQTEDFAVRVERGQAADSKPRDPRKAEGIHHGWRPGAGEGDALAQASRSGTKGAHAEVVPGAVAPLSHGRSDLKEERIFDKGQTRRGRPLPATVEIYKERPSVKLAEEAAAEEKEAAQMAREAGE